MGITINKILITVCFSLLLSTAFSQVQEQFNVHNKNAPAAITPLPAANFNWANLVNAANDSLNLTWVGAQIPSLVHNVFVSGHDAILFTDSISFVGKSNQWTTPGDFTFEIRFKRNITYNGTQQALFSRWPNGGPYVILCYFNASNQIVFYNTLSNVITGPTVTDSLTHSLSISQVSSTMRMFLDGTLVGTTTGGALATGSGGTPFRMGGYDGAEALVPLAFRGYLGDFRFSKIGRYTANYTPSSSYLTSDANTLALLPMDSVKGNYLGTPVYQTNIISRTGLPQATGGWANPDGPQTTLDGKQFITMSGYGSLGWTVYAAIAGNSYNQYKVQDSAIQTPVTGTLAGNGSIVPFNGQYYHFYVTDTNQVWLSKGATLNQAYTPGTKLAALGISPEKDPWVRVKSDGITLEMFLYTSSGGFYYFTSTDGLTWSSAYNITPDGFPNYRTYAGEPSAVKLGGRYVYFVDAASTTDDSSARRVGMGLWDGVNGMFTYSRLLIRKAGGPYISSYDSSPSYDANNARIVLIVANSTNRQATVPTDSDIGMWFIPVMTFNL